MTLCALFIGNHPHSGRRHLAFVCKIFSRASAKVGRRRPAQRGGQVSGSWQQLSIRRRRLLEALHTRHSRQPSWQNCMFANWENNHHELLKHGKSNGSFSKHQLEPEKITDTARSITRCTLAPLHCMHTCTFQVHSCAKVDAHQHRLKAQNTYQRSVI